MSARKLITEHLDLWTGAVNKKSSSGRGSNSKIKLTGIKKLRGLILELAVRGLLTEQDTNEKDASEIVENLLKEQQRLVSDGLIKKPKSLKPLDESEKPHSLPKDWQWIRLGQTMEMYNGRAFKSSEWSTSGLPIVRIQNLNDPTAPTNHFAGQIDDRNVIGSGTFLISWSGTPGTSFGAFIWTRGSAALNQHINKCVFFGDYVNPRFMQLAVNGQMKNFIQSAQGGVGLKHVTKGVLTNALIALPPEEEQHRIVQKVDELMALCDRLEQQTSDQLEAHETLVDTLLRTLTQSENATELADNWARLAVHFDTLFTTEQSIEKLKQTILELSVRGLLVSTTDDGGESSNVLLNRLREEKQRLIAAKKAKDNGKIHQKAPKEPYYELPSTWLWVRFRELIWCYRGHNPPKSEFKASQQPGYVRFIQITDFKTDVNQVFVPLTPRNKMVYKGEIIIAAYRHIGKLSRNMEGAFNVALCKILEFQPMNRDYVELLIRTDLVKGELLRASERGHIPSMHSDHLLSLLVPLPPLKQQQEIITKVEELTILCDQLKERLNQASETRCQLAETVVENALH